MGKKQILEQTGGLEVVRHGKEANPGTNRKARGRQLWVRGKSLNKQEGQGSPGVGERQALQ